MEDMQDNKILPDADCLQTSYMLGPRAGKILWPKLMKSIVYGRYVISMT
jgi:hypothetical protein